MTGSLFSPSWYRVAGLTPRIRSHAQIHRHQYRGQTWYVLQDLSSERFQRVSPAGYLIIGLMNGQRTVQEIWAVANTRLGDDAPTQDEMIQLLSKLHAADVLQCDVPPDTEELLQRYESHQRRKWQQQLFSVFSWRIPLFDPERFLRRLLPFVRPFIGWVGLLLWLSVVGTAVLMVGTHWAVLTQDIVDRMLAPQNLVLLWLSFPIIKILHELGHTLVTQAFGGEIHDMGVIILVLTPVPYVDASSAWAFREKWRRVVVNVSAPVEGLVEKVAVDRGDLVVENQVLATLESSLERAEVELARFRSGMEAPIQVNQTRIEFGTRKLARVEKLFKQDAILPLKDLDEAETEKRLAEAGLLEALENRHLAELELQRATAALVRRTIRSPITGVVVERFRFSGEFANDQTPILKLAQLDPLHVEVFVPVSLLGKITVGMRAQVVPEAPMNGAHIARVTVVNRVVDAASGTFGVRLELRNPSYHLPAGLKCKVRFPLKKALK